MSKETEVSVRKALLGVWHMGAITGAGEMTDEVKKARKKKRPSSKE